MAIQFIDNQPITFRTSWETDSECKTSLEKACTIYSRDDYMFAQFKQTPCGSGDNLFCDPNFTNDNAQLITNGSFTTNASGWTLTLNTYDAINKRIQFVNGLFGVGGTLVQSGVGTTFSYYTIKFTVGGGTQGNVRLYLGGNMYMGQVFTEGTYELTLEWDGAGTDIKFGSNGFFDGWIDDISVKQPLLESDDCWQGDVNEWRVNNEFSITKYDSTSDVLVAKMPSIPLGTYVRLRFNVTNMTQGVLTVKDGLNNTLLTINQNAQYDAFYTVSFVSEVNFYTDTEWNGTISDVTVVEYNNAFTFILTDGTNQYNLSPEVEYVQDWVTLKADMSGIPGGCYQLIVYDACGYALNQEIVSDTTLVNSGDWYFNTPQNCNAVFSGSGTLEINGIGGTANALFEFYNLNGVTSYMSGIQGSSYIINYEITSGQIDKPLNIFILNEGEKNLYDPGTLALQITQSNTTYSGQFIFDCDPININPQFIFQVLGGLPIGQKSEVTYISLIVQAWTPGQATAHYSNCIEVREDTDCTKWVAGTNGEDSFGFHFDNDNVNPFQLGARVRSMLMNPKYPGDFKRYNDARGKFTTTRASSDKTYTLFIDYTDEHTHDWLRLAIHSDTVNIGYSYDSNDQYVAIDGDYEPEWPSTLGDWPSAQARVEVQKKISTLFNNNAG